MNSLDKIKGLNPTLQNGMINAEEYDVLVVGRKVSAKEGETAKMRFVENTNPTAAAKEAGVTIQQYLRASFSRSGAIVTSGENNNEESFRGSKKPQPGNIFKNDRLNLFNFIVGKLKKGEYKEVAKVTVMENGQPVERPVVRVNATVWGARVALTVPRYRLTERNATGARVDLTGPKYNPSKDNYDKNAARTSLTLRFWADIDDLEEVESLAVSQYERFVMPYEVGEKLVVETKGNEVKQTIETEPITEDDNETKGDEGGAGEDEV